MSKYSAILNFASTRGNSGSLPTLAISQILYYQNLSQNKKYI